MILSSPTAQGIAISPEARALHAESLVVDATLPWLKNYWSLATLKRLHAGGVTCVSLTVMDFPTTFEGVTALIHNFRSEFIRGIPWLQWVSTTDDIRAAKRAGRLALSVNVQETVQIGSDLSRVGALYALGVRHMLLAYQGRNFVADGCAEPADAGLSVLGRRVIAEMNRVGMVVDLSHTGRRSSLEATALSTQPVIYSHSNPRAVTEHIRNITDEQIKACAATGGVVGVVGIGAFMGDASASTETLFRHIDYLVQLVGISHVGLGTDFLADTDALWRALSGPSDYWPDPSGTQLYEGRAFAPEQYVELTQTLLDHGYTEADVKRVLGGNFMRVFDAVWKPA